MRWRGENRVSLFGKMYMWVVIMGQWHLRPAVDRDLDRSGWRIVEGEPTADGWRTFTKERKPVPEGGLTYDQLMETLGEIERDGQGSAQD